MPARPASPPVISPVETLNDSSKRVSFGGDYRPPGVHGFRETADAKVAMERRWIEFTGRLPADLYRDALDLANVFNESLSKWLAQAIGSYVDAQLTRGVVRSAVETVRTARRSRSSDGATGRTTARSRIRKGRA